MSEIYFITSNKGKLAEVKQILGMEIKSKSLEIEEIQAVGASNVAEDKARRAYAILKKPVIVEDTALYLKSLKGFPGALIKFMEMHVGYAGICRTLDPYKDRSATAESCIAFYDGKEPEIFSGTIKGTIAMKPRGGYGFGFDCVFIPRGYSKTFAEMGTAEKNRISHRKKAVLKLKRYLTKRKNG